VHVELYDKKGAVLVPVPAEALGVLMTHALHKLAADKTPTQTRRKLREATDVAAKAISDIRWTSEAQYQAEGLF
jgi:hypothetical protein